MSKRIFPSRDTLPWISSIRVNKGPSICRPGKEANGWRKGFSFHLSPSKLKGRKRKERKGRKRERESEWTNSWNRVEIIPFEVTWIQASRDDRSLGRKELVESFLRFATDMELVRLKFFSMISISFTDILLIYLFNRITSEFDNYSRLTQDIFQVDFSISRSYFE